MPGFGMAPPGLGGMQAQLQGVMGSKPPSPGVAGSPGRIGAMRSGAQRLRQRPQRRRPMQGQMPSRPMGLPQEVAPVVEQPPVPPMQMPGPWGGLGGYTGWGG
jgi:hypothetical protein